MKLSLRSIRLWPLCLAFLIGLALPHNPSWANSAATPEALSPAQKSAVETIVRDYLKAHPEVVLDALKALQEQQQTAQQGETERLLKANRGTLNQDGESFAVGPSEAAVTVIEFFDYRCPYCKQITPTFTKLMAEKPDVRFVFKELPVLGPESVTASRAALAVLKLDRSKYLAFHNALLAERGALTDARIFDIAGRLGLDVARVRATMKDEGISTRLKANHALANTLGIDGTPTFIVGDAVVPGAVDYASMVELIDQAAKHCASC